MVLDLEVPWKMPTQHLKMANVLVEDAKPEGNYCIDRMLEFVNAEMPLYVAPNMELLEEDRVDMLYREDWA